MIDLHSITMLLLVVVVLINIIAVIAITTELVTGSYKKYLTKSDEHYRQLSRIENELKKRRER